MSAALGGAAPARARRMPWPPLIALAGCAAIGLVFASPVAHQAPSPTVTARLLRFVPDGTVTVVEDAASGAVLARVPLHGHGFAPGFLHALAVLRTRYGVPETRPFRLALLADDRLVLTDPSTPVRIDVESFGPTNATAIARYLVAGNGRR